MKTPSNFSIKHWAEDDKPREKLMQKGKKALSDAELIAILIGSGSRNESAVELSKRILASVNHNINHLSRLSLQQLMEFKGIGEAKAITIAAALELGKRRREEETAPIKKIISSKDSFLIMQPIIGDLHNEEFWVLYLNNSNTVVHKAQLSKGGLTQTLVDVRLILKIALEQNAVAMVLAHNHPSGRLETSQEDIEITKKIQNAARQLNIKVFDHIIVTENNYYSFADDFKL